MSLHKDVGIRRTGTIGDGQDGGRGSSLQRRCGAARASASASGKCDILPRLARPVTGPALALDVMERYADPLLHT